MPKRGLELGTLCSRERCLNRSATAPYISTESQEAIAEDDPFKELQDEINIVCSVQPDLTAEDIDGASLIDINAAAVKPPPTDTEILAWFLEADGTNDDESADDGGYVEDVQMECPERNELLHAVKLLKRFSLFSNAVENIQSYMLTN